MLRPEMHGAICWSTFDVARRRSELSATYTRTKLLIASTLFAALCVTTPLIAAPAGGAGQPSVVTPMTRNDVERILREAKSAIAKGDLEGAEKLVTRAENARITYSMFHFGDTPASVRRELNRARRTAGSPSGSTTATAVKNDAASQTALGMLSQKKDVAGQGTVDPFAARSRTLNENAALPARDEIKLGTTNAAGSDLPAEQALPAQDPQRLPAPGVVNNPFVTKSTGAGSTSRYALGAEMGETAPRDVAKSPTAQDTKKAVVPSRYARTDSQVQPVQFTEVAPPVPPQGPEARVGSEELPAPILGSTAGEPAAAANAETADPSLIDTADASQQVLARQLSAEVGKRQSEAKRLHTEDPERALAILRETQQMVKDSKLPESAQRELLTRIDITLNQVEKFAKGHGGEIELEKQNAEVLQTIEREREVDRKIKQEIADGIEEFNKLRDEHRYAEAEIVARRLYELDPLDPTTNQVLQTAKFIRREMLNRELSMAREEGNQRAYTDVESASVINVGDENPLVFDPKRWDQFAKKRVGPERQRRRTERELEIEKQLKMPVQLRYEDTPLSQVIDELSKLTGINIYLDPQGLTQEAVNSDSPVDLLLNKEISLESALNLILEPLHLSYVVKDDVLKITSEQLRDGEIYAATYNVSDLVIPIPNFVPSSNIGLQGLINEAHASSNPAQKALGLQGPSVLVNDRQQPQTGPNGQVLAQQFGATPGSGMSQSTVPIGSGPGGMGAGANADFDSLIDLIVSTVSTETWAENGGGEAEIRPFPTNLSLVISQTQAVHEEIAELLEQLRRLQDLQVTIEVRFIRLNDSFFERIGVDFDMDVNDTGYNGNPATTDLQPFGPRSNTVGAVRAATGDLPAFTSDLDIPFRQDSFNVTQVIPFGPAQVQGGLNFGFAILSDIEAYFLIEAAQGDTRTNVLNAPKVTLFNGQQAFVSDVTQRPFVVGVIPVVGEFAAAQQPVIVVLNEGTMMTIQAVVSEDRRYVRMTIVPFFTQIGDVDEFTFEGSTSSSSSSSSSDDDEDGKNESEEESEEEVRSGVTVQLPSFSFVSVVTTVSVPDGGTVLLGGIKRLSEGRNEFGVPLLSKVPYINRLFRNVSIGRETDSLMMMVTPRIIIQEEEEERLGIQVP
jgi:general secretion pathway protein D